MTDVEIDLTPAYRRIRLPLILFGVVALVMAGSNYVVLNIVTQSQMRLNKSQREVAALNRRIRELSDAAKDFDTNEPIFAEIERTGFLTPPNFAEAERTLRLSADANLINEASFEAEATQRMTLREEGDYRASLIDVPITIRMQALLDDHLFGYMDAVMQGLPGLVAIREMSVERLTANPAPVINEIMDSPPGTRPSMFTGTVTLDWMTLELEEIEDAGIDPR